MLETVCVTTFNVYTLYKCNQYHKKYWGQVYIHEKQNNKISNKVMDTNTNSSTLQDHSTLATSRSDIKLSTLNKVQSGIGDHESMANHTLSVAETVSLASDYDYKMNRDIKSNIRPLEENLSDKTNSNTNTETDIINNVSANVTDSVNVNENDGTTDPDNNNTHTLYFFNYHEYSETYYADLDTPLKFKGHTEAESLVITHFPNIHAPINSVQFNETRIVRIPRRFDTSVSYPCFSNVLPGSEPAAITNTVDGLQFVPRGLCRDGQVYGFSSVSPLSRYLTNEEFKPIIDHINGILETMYTVPNNWTNYRDIILGFLTLGLWYLLFSSSSPSFIRLLGSRLGGDESRVNELEGYIESVNRSEKFRKNGIRIVSPRRSGFLSLDFEIPRPS